MRSLIDVLDHLRGLKWKYLLHGSYVYVSHNSTLKIGKNVRIKHSKIHVSEYSKVVISDKVRITNAIIVCNNSSLYIGEESIVENGSMPMRCMLSISNKSNVSFGTHNRLRMMRVWTRFGGQLHFGNYINLNEYSEIRCDENVTVGDFVAISYNVKIWDTNTHEFERIEQRRERWKKLYLKRDVSEKPRTSPVYIGSDTWIGENVAILKGTTIGERCIVGFGTLVSGKSIPNRTTVLNKTELKFISNNL